MDKTYTIEVNFDELRWIRAALVSARAKVREQEDNDSKEAYKAMNDLIGKIDKAEKEN